MSRKNAASLLVIKGRKTCYPRLGTESRLFGRRSDTLVPLQRHCRRWMLPPPPDAPDASRPQLVSLTAAPWLRLLDGGDRCAPAGTRSAPPHVGAAAGGFVSAKPHVTGAGRRTTEMVWSDKLARRGGERERFSTLQSGTNACVLELLSAACVFG